MLETVMTRMSVVCFELLAETKQGGTLSTLCLAMGEWSCMGQACRGEAAPLFSAIIQILSLMLGVS